MAQLVDNNILLETEKQVIYRFVRSKIKALKATEELEAMAASQRAEQSYGPPPPVHTTPPTPAWTSAPVLSPNLTPPHIPSPSLATSAAPAPHEPALDVDLLDFGDELESRQVPVCHHHQSMPRQTLLTRRMHSTTTTKSPLRPTAPSFGLKAPKAKIKPPLPNLESIEAEGTPEWSSISSRWRSLDPDHLRSAPEKISVASVSSRSTGLDVDTVGDEVRPEGSSHSLVRTPFLAPRYLVVILTRHFAQILAVSRSPSTTTGAVVAPSPSTAWTKRRKEPLGPFVCPDWLRHKRVSTCAPCQHKSRHGPYLHEESTTLPMEVRECYFWRYNGDCVRRDCSFEHKETAHGLAQGRPKSGKKKDPVSA